MRGIRIRSSSLPLFARLLPLLLLTPILARGGQVRERDPAWAAPAVEASKVNPLAGRADAVAGGRKLFHQRCATCHGEDGRGGTKAPDLIRPDAQAQTDGALFWKISGGDSHRGMPGFSFFPQAQRWQLVLHLRALAAAASPDPSGSR